MSARRARSLAVFSGAWYPREGGAERQMRDLLEVLASDGWKITVIACGQASFSPTETTAAGVRVVRILPGSPSEPTDRPRGREMLAGVLQATRDLRPDLVISSLISVVTAAGHLFGIGSRVPRILRIGGHDLDRLRLTRSGRAQGRLMVRGSDAIVTNARHLFAQVRPFVPRARTKLVVIANGISVQPRPGPRAPGPTRVIYYSNGGPPKNEPAFTELVRHCPQVQFRAVGNAATLAPMGNLELRGWRDPVAPELAWADWAVNTSHSEGSPNFCLQGLGLGRLVAGFDIPAMTELAAAYPGWVHLAPYGDVAALAEQLRRPLPPPAPAPDVPTITAAAAQWEALLMSLLRR